MFLIVLKTIYALVTDGLSSDIVFFIVVEKCFHHDENVFPSR